MALSARFLPLLATLVLAATLVPVCQGRYHLGDALDDAKNCHNSTSEATCLTKANCTFCESSLLPSGCFFEPETLLLPKSAWLGGSMFSILRGHACGPNEGLQKNPRCW